MGPYSFRARLEEQAAPKTCALIASLLPLRTKIIHARWSGEALWIPGGDVRLALDYENNTSHPAPGELLPYPDGRSEMEILFPYGPTLFSSKAGQLSGNHFAIVLYGGDSQREFGHLVLWQGAQDMCVELSDAGSEPSLPVKRATLP